MAAETVFLHESGDRVLAENLTATSPIPPWNNSAMDGYALRHTDLSPGATFRVVEDVLAGRMPTRSVGTGEASKIMTGAPMPGGADTVLPVEWVEHADGARMVVGHSRLPTPGEHVRLVGEDIQA